MRAYDLVDIELCKCAPHSWAPQHWEQMGNAEYFMRRRPEMLSQRTHLQVHMLVRLAINSYRLNGGESPWDDNYERKPFAEMLPVPEPVPLNSAVEHIIAVVAAHGRTPLSEIRMAVSAKGYTPGTVDARVAEMHGTGVLKKKGHGVYDLGHSGAQHPIAKAVKAAIAAAAPQEVPR